MDSLVIVVPVVEKGRSSRSRRTSSTTNSRHKHKGRRRRKEVVTATTSVSTRKSTSRSRSQRVKGMSGTKSRTETTTETTKNSVKYDVGDRACVHQIPNNTGKDNCDENIDQVLMNTGGPDNVAAVADVVNVVNVVDCVPKTLEPMEQEQQNNNNNNKNKNEKHYCDGDSAVVVRARQLLSNMKEQRELYLPYCSTNRNSPIINEVDSNNRNNCIMNSKCSDKPAMEPALVTSGIPISVSTTKVPLHELPLLCGENTKQKDNHTQEQEQEIHNLNYYESINCERRKKLEDMISRRQMETIDGGNVDYGVVNEDHHDEYNERPKSLLLLADSSSTSSHDSVVTLEIMEPMIPISPLSIPPEYISLQQQFNNYNNENNNSSNNINSRLLAMQKLLTPPLLIKNSHAQSVGRTTVNEKSNENDGKLHCIIDNRNMNNSNDDNSRTILPKLSSSYEDDNATRHSSEKENTEEKHHHRRKLKESSSTTSTSSSSPTSSPRQRKSKRKTTTKRTATSTSTDLDVHDQELCNKISQIQSKHNRSSSNTLSPNRQLQERSRNSTSSGRSRVLTGTTSTNACRTSKSKSSHQRMEKEKTTASPCTNDNLVNIFILPPRPSPTLLSSSKTQHKIVSSDVNNNHALRSSIKDERNTTLATTTPTTIISEEQKRKKVYKKNSDSTTSIVTYPSTISGEGTTTIKSHGNASVTGEFDNTNDYKINVSNDDNQEKLLSVYKNKDFNTLLVECSTSNQSERNINDEKLEKINSMTNNASKTDNVENGENLNIHKKQEIRSTVESFANKATASTSKDNHCHTNATEAFRDAGGNDDDDNTASQKKEYKFPITELEYCTTFELEHYTSTIPYDHHKNSICGDGPRTVKGDIKEREQLRTTAGKSWTSTKVSQGSEAIVTGVLGRNHDSITNNCNDQGVVGEIGSCKSNKNSNPLFQQPSHMKPRKNNKKMKVYDNKIVDASEHSTTTATAESTKDGCSNSSIGDNTYSNHNSTTSSRSFSLGYSQCSSTKDNSDRAFEHVQGIVSKQRSEQIDVVNVLSDKRQEEQYSDIRQQKEDYKQGSNSYPNGYPNDFSDKKKLLECFNAFEVHEGVGNQLVVMAAVEVQKKNEDDVYVVDADDDDDRKIIVVGTDTDRHHGTIINEIRAKTKKDDVYVVDDDADDVANRENATVCNDLDLQNDMKASLSIRDEIVTYVGNVIEYLPKNTPLPLNFVGSDGQCQNKEKDVDNDDRSTSDSSSSSSSSSTDDDEESSFDYTTSSDTSGWVSASSKNTNFTLEYDSDSKLNSSNSHRSRKSSRSLGGIDPNNKNKRIESLKEIKKSHIAPIKDVKKGINILSNKDGKNIHDICSSTRTVNKRDDGDDKKSSAVMAMPSSSLEGLIVGGSNDDHSHCPSHHSTSSSKKQVCFAPDDALTQLYPLPDETSITRRYPDQKAFKATNVPLFVPECLSDQRCSAGGGLYNLTKLSDGFNCEKIVSPIRKGTVPPALLKLSSDFRCGTYGSHFDIACRSGCLVVAAADAKNAEDRSREARNVVGGETSDTASSSNPFEMEEGWMQTSGGGMYDVALRSGLTKEDLHSRQPYSVSINLSWRDRRQQSSSSNTLVLSEFLSDNRCGASGGSLYLALSAL